MKIADWQELEKKLVWAYRGPPRGLQGMHTHPFLSAWLLEAGQVTIQEKTKQVRLGAGKWVFPPLRSDTRMFSQDARILSISFTMCWPNGRMLFESQETLSVCAKDHPDLEQSARQLLRVVEQRMQLSRTDMKWQDADLNTYLEVERLFPDWLKAYCEIMRKLNLKIVDFNREDERVVKAKFYLDHVEMSKPFRMSDAASGLGVSPSHLNRLFIEEHGISLRAYYDRRRIQAVRTDLERTQIPFKEMAYAYGFHDAAAFSNWVKKNFGCSPRKLRPVE